MVLRRAPALALAASFAAACARTPATAEPQTLRVMTYNIQAGRGDLAGVAAAIDAADPDIVGLQEVAVHWGEVPEHPDQAAYLADALGMDVFFGPIYTIASDSPGAPPRQFGLAVLSRNGFVATRNHEITRLSTQIAEPEPAPMPGFVEAVVRVGGTEVRVFDTHLDYRGDASVRRMQVADMLAIIGGESAPTLLLGDMNARPNAVEIQPLFVRFEDAWGSDRGSGYTGPNPEPDRRIDYILISQDFVVRGARVPATAASDHRPVVVDLELRPGRQ